MESKMNQTEINEFKEVIQKAEKLLEKDYILKIGNREIDTKAYSDIYISPETAIKLNLIKEGEETKTKQVKFYHINFIINPCVPDNIIVFTRKIQFRDFALNLVLFRSS